MYDNLQKQQKMPNNENFEQDPYNLNLKKVQNLQTLRKQNSASRYKKEVTFSGPDQK